MNQLPCGFINSSENDEAARELWDRYFHRLVGLARRVMRSNGKRMADEQDVNLETILAGTQRQVQRRLV